MTALPTHGWTGGLFGRRDKLFLTLAGPGGLTVNEVRALKFGDVTITGPGLQVRVGHRQVTLPRGTDPRLCPAGTWVSWHQVMRLALRPRCVR